MSGDALIELAHHCFGLWLLSLFSAKPLPEAMLTYFQLDSEHQTSVTFEIRIVLFSFESVICKL